MTVSVGIGAHVAAGGHPPAVWSVLGLASAFVVACWALSTQRWTVRPLLAVFLLAQVGTHVASMVQHPHHSSGGAEMALSHVAGAVLLTSLVTRGELSLARLVDHLALRCLGPRLVRTPLVVGRPPSALLSRPLLRLEDAPARGRAPPVDLLLPVS